MTFVAEKPVSEKARSFIPKIFVLCTKRASGWVKDGTGVRGVPEEYLNRGKSLLLDPMSTLYLGPSLGTMATQYVINAPTIYLNDYYERKDGSLVLESKIISAQEAKENDYQFRPGLKSLGYDLKEEFRRTSTMNNEGICFDFGELNVTKYGSDPMLIKFLMEHSENTKSPRYDENPSSRRPKMLSFMPFVPEQKAAKEKIILNLDADAAAMEYVIKLRRKVEGGFEYNEDLMDGILYILGAGAGLNKGDVMQKFIILVNYAKTDGALFMNTINKEFDGYRMNIGVAKSMKVINFNALGVQLNRKDKTTEIYAFKDAKDDATCNDELATYFLGEAKGRSEYSEMMQLSEVAKIAALNSEKKK